MRSARGSHGHGFQNGDAFLGLAAFLASARAADVSTFGELEAAARLGEDAVLAGGGLGHEAVVVANRTWARSCGARGG